MTGATNPTVDGPAVWRGVEIDAHTGWKVELGDDDVAELLAGLDHARRTGLEPTRIGVDHFPLPGLGPRLEALVDDLVDGPGFVLLRGVPVDGLPEPDVELLCWGIGLHIGIPVPQNDAGDHLVHVRDQGLDFSDPEVRGYQTTSDLSYHSDSSDVVGLLCRRPARRGGVSTLVSASAVYNEAVRRRLDLLDVLQAPWWWDRRKKDLSASFFRCRIFALGAGRLTSYYGREHIESATRGEHVPPLSDRQIEALDLLDAIANDPGFALDMQFRPGDLQLLNNRLVWHARTDYEDWPEPDRKRDLVRLWLTLRRDLDLPADFADGGITTRSAAFT